MFGGDGNVFIVFGSENIKRKGQNMDYDKLESELYDYIKSALSQARFGIAQAQARAYVQEAMIALESIKRLKEIVLLNRQLESLVAPKE